MSWINLTKYLADTGFSKDQFENWKRHPRHSIERGIHYMSGNNGCSVDKDRMDEWWQEGGPHVSATAEEDLESESSTKARSSLTKHSASKSTRKVVSPRRYA